jgi:hypothetical protein
MYGSVTLQQDVTIPAGKTLDFLSSSQILTIPEGVALTNEGTINGSVDGTGTVNN